MNFYKLNSIDDKNFKISWKIYEEAFPKEEKRFLSEQLELLSEPSYSAIACIVNDKIVGLLFYWELDEFYFIEHLAINKQLRGQDYGSKILTKFLKDKQNVVLEIEKITDTITQKRFDFYKKFDFYINEYTHYQIPFRKDDLPLELLILSYKKQLNNEEYKALYKNMQKALTRF